MTVINSNIAALRAQSGSRAAEKMMQTAMERLSTGKRINSAKDDAAGLAIATRQTSEIRGLAVAIRNANDGISLAQTAEGAMGEITNMLQRMKELAVQSSNGTLGADERAALQAETDQLLEQINVVSKNTSFNGLKLLDGSLSSLKLQTGPNAGDQISLSLASVSASELGLTAGSAGTVVSGRVAGDAAFAVGGITLNGVNAFEGTAALNITDAKSLAEAINANTARSGVVATASNSYTSAALGDGSFASGTINGVAVAAAASAAELVDEINSNDYGVTAQLNDDGSITLSNATGEDITTTGGAFGTTSSDGFISLKNVDGSNVVIGGTNLVDAGLNASDGVSFTGTIVTANTALAAGDVLINGVDVGVVAANAGSATLQADDYVTAINALTSETGVVATNNAGVITLASVDGSAVRVEGAAESKIGFNSQGGTDGMSFGLDISSQSAASAAMDAIDAALDLVSSKRGDLGAIQNRLETTVSTLSTASTNLIDARSRTEDADFSAETTNLAKAQILSQAATAMLAQANQSGQNVLSLLR